MQLNKSEQTRQRYYNNFIISNACLDVFVDKYNKLRKFHINSINCNV